MDVETESHVPDSYQVSVRSMTLDSLALEEFVSITNTSEETSCVLCALDLRNLTTLRVSCLHEKATTGLNMFLSIHGQHLQHLDVFMSSSCPNTFNRGRHPVSKLSRVPMLLTYSRVSALSQGSI